jgi:hypothetical protein
MRIAYLIVAHNTPNHLRRLITALSSPDCEFFVHLNKRSRFRDYAEIASPNVRFLRHRIAVYRSEFSLVEAVVSLIRGALRGPSRCDYFVLLSGSDYPLRSASYIESFFEKSNGSEFINIVCPGRQAALQIVQIPGSIGAVYRKLL